MKPKVFIIDVDGTLTDGKMYYTKDGKFMKAFSVDDSDALKWTKKFINIIIVTADKTGFSISQERIMDMGFYLYKVGAEGRLKWIEERFELKDVIYMGDGIFDNQVFEEVRYAVTVNNALDHVKENADYITKRNGGDRAVAEACLHIMERFFKV